MGKRIAVCLDGTWNKPGQTDQGVATKTNVLKLYEALANGPDQVAGYDEGVGTEPDDKIAGGAFGWGLFEQIKAAYRQVRASFAPGDDIYVFGFSRGAYSARSLAGMILRCGIVRGDLDDVPVPQALLDLLTTQQEAKRRLDVADKAFAMYKYAYDEKNRAAVDAFKRQYCHDTPVRFVGVWDTVGALGIPDELFVPALRKLDDALDAKLYGFLDTELSPRVQAAYHAVAIDEHRKPFQPTLWTDPAGAAPRINVAGSNVEQVWFAGAHSNVGGGYADTGLSDIALKWMIERAQRNGLTFDAAKVAALRPDPAGARRDSLGEFIDFGAKAGKNALLAWFDKVATRFIAFDRKIPEGATVHDSVNRRLGAPAVAEPGRSAPYSPAPTLKLAQGNGTRAVDPGYYRLGS